MSEKFTLNDPSQATMFEVGDVVVFRERPPRWWVRLWRWIRRGFRKPPPPSLLTVIGVNQADGVLIVADRSN